jgi:hypothetical protein
MCGSNERTADDGIYSSCVSPIPKPANTINHSAFEHADVAVKITSCSQRQVPEGNRSTLQPANGSISTICLRLCRLGVCFR